MAELGSRPSQIWRAILEGRDILKQGIIRRIGNGHTTNIWDHNWIPKEGSLRPIVSRVLNPSQLVSELLHPATGSWNENRVREVFLPTDAEAIMRIPVCTSNVDDFWAWHPEKKGRFTVSSTYKFMIKTKITRESWLEGRSGSSSTDREEWDWTSLWSLKVPSKVRIFIWRLARHSLPTTDVLNRRNMATRDACPLCGAPDSWRHALVSCTSARCTWALSDPALVAHMAEIEDPSAKNWLFRMHEDLDQQSFTKMIVTLWVVWYARRKAIHEGIFQSPMQTSSFVTSYLNELQQLEKPIERRVQAVQQGGNRSWRASPLGVVKINVDGAVGRHRRGGAVAAVCRDHTGAYLGSSAVVYREITDPTILETFACREALALAEDLQSTRMMIASDCKGVIQDINEGTNGPHAAIVHEITLRRGFFNSVAFVFQRRNHNFEAHSLAKFACNLGVDRHVWLGVPHDQSRVPMNIAII